jgi:ribosomal subunit interface protein
MGKRRFLPLAARTCERAPQQASVGSKTRSAARVSSAPATRRRKPVEIAVHGRHVELAPDTRQHAAEKVAQLEKYLRGLERAEVLFSDGKKGHLADPVTCEVSVEGHGHVVRAAGTAEKPEAAFEVAVDKAAMQLIRLKKRLVSRSRPRHKSVKGATPASDGETEEI